MTHPNPAEWHMHMCLPPAQLSLLEAAPSDTLPLLERPLGREDRAVPSTHPPSSFCLQGTNKELLTLGEGECENVVT